MSKSIRSDGTVNAAVRAMCQRESGLAAYSRERVDEVLTTDTLKQCDYSTLALLAFCYREAFGAMHCPTQQHIEIKAWQSATYRSYMGKTSGKRRAVLSPDEDPFAVLDAAKETAKAGSGATAEPPAERKETAKEEEQARVRQDAAEVEAAHRPKAEPDEQHQEEVNDLLSHMDDEE